jgi:hypothetical protein
MEIALPIVLAFFLFIFRSQVKIEELGDISYIDGNNSNTSYIADITKGGILYYDYLPLSVRNPKDGTFKKLNMIECLTRR